MTSDRPDDGGDEAALASAAVELVRAALGRADVEAAADRHRLSLTRFANSRIHQHVAEDATKVRIRIHHDGRTAAASASVLGVDALAPLVERVVDAVRVAPRDPGWPGVTPVVPLGDAAPTALAGATWTDADRAGVVRAFVDGARGLETAGFCRTNRWSGALATSAGQRVHGTSAECGFAGIARYRTADGTVVDGVARWAPTELAEIDGALLGARAAAKARASEDAVEVPPGRYEVVLEPTAVADVLETLAAGGFNGKAVNEQRSFVRLGEAQLDESITLVDDPLAVGLAFDREGTPRRRLVLVERGVSVALTHDRRSAKEAGAASTGHAAEAAFSFGPSARHLGLVPALGGAAASGDAGQGRVASATGDAGDAALDGTSAPAADASVLALVAQVERGLLVSDLWYTRMLDPRALTITGLTRNGVWLIEGGRITRPLRNLRFTQSYAHALMPGNVLGVGAIAHPVPGDTYTALAPRWTCPALRLASWNMTGGASG